MCDAIWLVRLCGARSLRQLWCPETAEPSGSVAALWVDLRQPGATARGMMGRDSPSFLLPWNFTQSSELSRPYSSVGLAVQLAPELQRHLGIRDSAALAAAAAWPLRLRVFVAALRVYRSCSCGLRVGSIEL